MAGGVSKCGSTALCGTLSDAKNLFLDNAGVIENNEEKAIAIRESTLYRSEDSNIICGRQTLMKN